MNKDTFFTQNRTLNLKGSLISFDSPQIMGIINVNSDSFYEQSRSTHTDTILQKIEGFIRHGATFVDLGVSSSRPGAILKSADEENQILVPLVQKIAETFPQIFISIDTVYAKVAQETVEAGAHLINDISAGAIDEQMWTTVAKLGVPYVLMHMQGKPENMQLEPQYPKGVVVEVHQFFKKKLIELRNLGVHDVLLDVGFGFGKTVAHNYELLANLHLFQSLAAISLVGVSRKSMIYKPLGINPEEALNGTTVLHTLALMNGAQILRVHDVKEAQQAVKLVQLYQNK